MSLPSDSASRKAIPLVTGVLDYFPDALVEVAKVSKAGNDKHNPGEPLHHSRNKSTDHADSLGRHLLDRGKIDPDTGVRHSAEIAWRALAMLQQELEDAGAPLARGAVIPGEPDPYEEQRSPRRGEQGHQPGDVYRDKDSGAIVVLAEQNPNGYWENLRIERGAVQPVAGWLLGRGALDYGYRKVY